MNKKWELIYMEEIETKEVINRTDEEEMIRKVEEVSQEIREMYFEKLKKAEKTKEFITNFLKNYYQNIKEEKTSNPFEEEEFQHVQLKNYFLREVKRTKLHWTKEGKEELFYSGRYGVFSPNKFQKSNYDLSKYQLPSNPHNDYVKYNDYHLSRSEMARLEDLINEPNENKLTSSETTQLNEIILNLPKLEEKEIEEVLDLFVKTKELHEEYDKNYQKLRKNLLQVMKGANLKETETGDFKIYSERTKYDLSKMYNQETGEFDTLLERVTLATNGEKSFCLDKEIEVPFTEKDLKDIEVIKKIVRKKEKKEKILNLLGQNYYFITGLREVEAEEFFTESDVVQGEIEKLVEKDSIKSEFLKEERVLIDDKDITSVFEIVSEENFNNRRDVFYKIKMNKAQKLRRIREQEKINN